MTQQAPATPPNDLGDIDPLAAAANAVHATNDAHARMLAAQTNFYTQAIVELRRKIAKLESELVVVQLECTTYRNAANTKPNANNGAISRKE